MHFDVYDKKCSEKENEYMYKSLYIGNREGGIINEISKADQQGDPVVIVGLGGTGVDAISQLKIKLRKQIKPNNQDKIEKGEETEPVYSNIRFLGIDSDKGWMSGSALSDDEKMNLHNKFFKAMFMPDKLPALKADKRYQWMDIDYVATHLPPNTEGAGGLRQFARWLVIDHAQELKQKLSNIITNACMNKESGRLIIHVVSGISGGMGSGSFIDVCYILRHILNELGNNNALIYGYFVLPDAVISKDGIRSNLLKKQSNERNGMASLLEIEHLMNLHDSKEWFEQDYGAFYIRTQEQLVNLCHFVSATDTNGVLVTNAYEYSLNVIGDYIIAYLSDEKADKATDGESQPIDM